MNQVSEGSLDTSLLNGLSLQRTFNDTMVVNGSDRKMVGRLSDGSTYDDTTFEMPVNDVPAGNPVFSSGTPVIRSAITSGHPTANVESGSTL